MRRMVYLCFTAVVLPVAAAAHVAVASRPEVGDRVAGLTAPFVANTGPRDPQVAYYARTQTGTVFVTRVGDLVYALRPKERAGSGWSVTERLLGAHPVPVAGQASPTNVSVFVGNDPGRWQAHVPSYTKVALGEVYPGITAMLQAYGTHVEKVFTVRPGTSPRRIRVQVRGAQQMAVDHEGALVVHTGVGEVHFSRPVAYQEVRGRRRDVKVGYVLAGDVYGFQVGKYDDKRPLTIDPLLQATYLGGSEFDQVTALAIDNNTGDVYAAGWTTSDDFPGTAGGAQSTNHGYYDGFIAHLDASLTTLYQVTYLGGIPLDGVNGLALDPNTGDVYVAGQTGSCDFPGTAGGAQATCSGTSDAFVARLDASLTTLNQATYLGGSGGESVYAVGLHPISGEVYVVGSTGSSDFPGTSGGGQSTYGGGTSDGFVARLNRSLTTLEQSTYLGGNGPEGAMALAIDASTGKIYVAGNTHATDFPGTTGGAQSAYAGGFADAFVARLDAMLTTLEQASYLGGTDADFGFSVAVSNATGDVYVSGVTDSVDFPGTAGGAQSAHGGGGASNQDGFVARMNPQLTALEQATYLGGSDLDAAATLALHPTTGEVYVGGFTWSKDFPGTSAGIQPRSLGDDGFVARLNAALTLLDRATYLGGTKKDDIAALALSAANDEVYVGGYTYSSDFPGTAGGVQPMAGAGDALVARLAGDLSSGLQHDTVVVPPAPLTIRIRQGDASVSALLKVKVRNADVGERVGHQIQLVVTDGTCPTGTVTGLPDFDPSTPGAQDTVLVVGGKRAAARIPLSFSAAAFTSLNRLVATRCTLQISAAAVVSGVNVDPTLSNNASGAEINVIDQNDPQLATAQESFIKSVTPIAVTIPRGAATTSKSVALRVGNADIIPFPDTYPITVTASDGTCPPGTVVGVNFTARNAPPSDTVNVLGGKTAAGKLALSFAAGTFDTPNALAPARCAVQITSNGTGVTDDANPSNNTTQLFIDVVDKNSR